MHHHQNAARLSLFYRHYFGRCSSELAQLVQLLFSRERSTHYSHRLHDFCYLSWFSKAVYVNTFFCCTTRLWNYLPIECFPLNYDLNGFEPRINRHISCSDYSTLHGVNPNFRKSFPSEIKILK